MRFLCIALCVLAACLAAGCASEDPTALDGSPIEEGKATTTKSTKSATKSKSASTKNAVASSGDDDDDSTSTSSATASADDGPVFDPSQVPNSGSSGANQTPTPETIEAACVDMVNQFRSTIGLPALARWTDEESCSDTEAQNDSQSGEAHGSFGQCSEMAQNECPGYPSPADQNLQGCLQQMWDEGPGGGHYENMTNTSYTQVSCGISADSGGTFWAVQNFK